MTQILDRIADSLHGEFRPASPDDYLALRLAARLGDPGAAAHYTVLISQYSLERLVYAFHKAMECRQRRDQAGRLFHDYLLRNSGGGDISHPRLVAVRVERRTIAIAVFAGTHLEGRRVLHLCSKPNRAEDSASGFIRSVLSDSDCSSVVIEPQPSQQDIQRSILHRAVVAQIRASNISMWEISKSTLLGAFAHPPLRTRGELRDIMVAIWPVPRFKRSEISALDAFALGLFIQTERLLNNF
jgi:hypothetical protein